jgi:hypothetical protein
MWIAHLHLCPSTTTSPSITLHCQHWTHLQSKICCITLSKMIMAMHPHGLRKSTLQGKTGFAKSSFTRKPKFCSPVSNPFLSATMLPNALSKKTTITKWIRRSHYYTLDAAMNTFHSYTVSKTFYKCWTHSETGVIVSLWNLIHPRPAEVHSP